MENSERFSKQMEFIVEIDKLKHIERQSALCDGTRQENDSEHSWHIALMAILLSEYANSLNIDQLKVVKMLLIHDLVEIDAGDTFAYDVLGNQDKEKREREAANRIFGILPDDQKEELLSLWEEFEAMTTPEARFASALDKLQAFYPDTAFFIISLLNFHQPDIKAFRIDKGKVLEEEIIVD